MFCLCFVAFLSLLCKTDAAVTAWTNPVITTPSGSGTSTQSIPESQVVGATPVTIAATGGASKAYAITSQTTTGKLVIAASTGVLSLATGFSFDYETAKTYVLTVTCDDGSSTETATVTVSITDANDNAPVFAIAQYAVTIADGATAGTELTTVTATDADTVGTITYSFTGGNTNTAFSISSSGVISVATGKTISKATTNGYTLTVQATDSVNAIASTSVLVVVKTCSSGTRATISSGIVMLVVATAFLF